MELVPDVRVAEQERSWCPLHNCLAPTLPGENYVCCVGGMMTMGSYDTLTRTITPTPFTVNLKLLELSAMRNGKRVVVRWKAERQPGHQTIYQLSKFCPQENRTHTAQMEVTMVDVCTRWQHGGRSGDKNRERNTQAACGGITMPLLLHPHLFTWNRYDACGRVSR